MWRVIAPRARPAAGQMAADEAVAASIAAGAAPPTIRFYTWSPGAVSIGCFQRLRDEVDVEACAARGIEVVRRRTGGGAVYHDPQGEITYSIIGPEGLFPPDIRASYREICHCIVAGLASLGLPAAFRPVNDVLVRGRKISGSAQTRRQGVLTQHGTVLYDLDRNIMFTVLRPPALKLADKGISAFGNGVTCAREEGCGSMEELYQALLKAFTSEKEWAFGELSPDEEALAQELAKKYRSDEWNAYR